VEFDEAPVCEGDVFGVRGSVVAVLPIPEGVCRVTAAALIKQTRSKQHVSAITHDIRSSWRVLVVGLASQHSSKPVYVYADVILDIPALYGSRLYRNCLDLFRDRGRPRCARARIRRDMERGRVFPSTFALQLSYLPVYSYCHMM
jgi:hypothetical protein